MRSYRDYKFSCNSDIDVQKAFVPSERPLSNTEPPQPQIMPKVEHPRVPSYVMDTVSDAAWKAGGLAYTLGTVIRYQTRISPTPHGSRIPASGELATVVGHVGGHVMIINQNGSMFTVNVVDDMFEVVG